jgi:hypothetical protein
VLRAVALSERGDLRFTVEKLAQYLSLEQSLASAVSNYRAERSARALRREESELIGATHHSPNSRLQDLGSGVPNRNGGTRWSKYGGGISLLFVPQRRHRIHARRATRGKIRCQHRDGEHNRRDQYVSRERRIPREDGAKHARGPDAQN